MIEFESFCVYGFCISYTKSYKVKLDAKSSRNEGNVAFESTEDGSVIVSWGPLTLAKERYSSLGEHARSSIERIRIEPKAKKVELIESKKVHVNTHEAVLSHIRMLFSLRRFWPFSKRFQEEIRSLHIHCEASQRYFVVYGMTTPDQSNLQKSIFNKIIKSFSCHEAEID